MPHPAPSPLCYTSGRAPQLSKFLNVTARRGSHYSLRFEGSFHNMSSADSLQPEPIDADTQQRLGPINTSLANAGILGRRINLNVLDKQSVDEDLRKIFQEGPDTVGDHPPQNHKGVNSLLNLSPRRSQLWKSQDLTRHLSRTQKADWFLFLHRSALNVHSRLRTCQAARSFGRRTRKSS